MALCSPGLILFLFVAGPLLVPGCLCFFPAIDDYDYYDGQNNPIQGGGAQPYEGQGDCYPYGSLPCSPPSPAAPPQQFADGSPSSGGKPSLTPPGSPYPYLPDGPQPLPGEMTPSRTPPPPLPWPPPPPSPRWNQGGSTPAFGVEQAEKTSSNVASKVGWAFVAVVLVLQVVLGAYLAYQWREMNRFGMWVEKVPSVSPPPSPAGFAPYTAAR